MDWNSKIKELIEDEDFYLSKLKKTPEFADWHITNLSKLNSNLGFYCLLEGDVDKAKSHFVLVGKLDIYLVKNFSKSHSRFLDFDIPRCTLPILSDNEPLIQQYAKLRYQRGSNAELSMDEMVEQGESAIWCNTVQFFMENNWRGVEENLNIIETITLKNLPKKEELLKLDYEFYKALYNQDKRQCEEVLEHLVSPKIHKRRNDNAVLSQYVSLPALGYAKLAWRHDLKIEVNSSLIPRELLPIAPLKNYEIPYDFLK